LCFIDNILVSNGLEQESAQVTFIHGYK